MSKKTFKTNLEEIENPALNFISSIPNKDIKKEEKIINEQMKITTLEGFKITPEAKSKRLQLLIQPSLYERMLLI